MSIEARSVVLQRIAAALQREQPKDQERINRDWQSLSREYQKEPRLSFSGKLELLEDRLRDYDAEVTRVADKEVAVTIAAVLAGRGGQPTLVPAGFPSRWIPDDASLVVEAGLSVRELDHFDGVVTGITVAIAETGTLVLQDVPGQGRRAATLVPDFHLGVVRAEDVVETVPEAFRRLAATSAIATTFVSGPSATADIEMTRIKGVHGPRFLHVLLVVD